MKRHYEITKIGAAQEQLEWAIKLFLEYQAYIPAITLAGAAEEVLGKQPGVTSSFIELRDQLAAEHNLAPKIVADNHLNNVRNWLKHSSEIENLTPLVSELETEAILMIVRGLTNLQRGGIASAAANAFDAWVHQNRSDLVD